MAYRSTYDQKAADAEAQLIYWVSQPSLMRGGVYAFGFIVIVLLAPGHN